jgi:iron complex outermembrane receptor protein
MRGVFTYILVLITGLFFSQNGEVKGKLVDDEKNFVPFSTVLLKNKKDSSLVKGEITNEQGEFHLMGLKNGEYFLMLPAVGHQKKFVSDLTISEAQQSLDLGIIQFEKKANQLGEVTVKVDKPFIEKQTDKTVVNIENSIIQTGSSVMEVLEKLPGVMVDQDGNIRLRGKQGVLILMDGKPMVLGGGDLANLLRGMPANSIQKIELITNPSAKWDAAGNAGIINIITKRNKQEGWNSSINLSYGQGRYHKINPSATFSYKRNRFNFFANYAYSDRVGFNNLILDRRFFFNDTLKAEFKTFNYILFPFKTHTPRIGMDYNLGKRTTISLIVAGVGNSIEQRTHNNTDISDGNQNLTGGYEFLNQSHDKFYSATLSSQLKHKLDSAGQEISVDLDYGTYDNNTDQLLTTNYFDAQREFSKNLTLVSKQTGSLELYSVKSDYTKPFRNGLNLDVGIKSSLVKSDKNMQFYDRVNDIDKFDTARSSHFLYNENINAAYLSLKKQFKMLGVQAGLRVEHTKADGRQVINDSSIHRNYVLLFPTLYLDHKLNDKNSLNISLGKRIDRPRYDQMNPFRRLIDITTYSEGNPYLLPQITYHSEISYSFKDMLFFTATYDYTRNNITDVLIQNSATRQTVQTVVNLDHVNYYSFDINLSKKVTKWWRTNSNVLSYYALYTGAVNSYSINQGTPSFVFNCQNYFTIKEGLTSELSLQYNYKNLYGVTLMRTTWGLNAGIQKSMMQKKATLTINCTDMFWHLYPTGITNFGNVSEDWRAIRDTRVVTVSFSYKFGKGQTGRMRRNTGADDEKNRMG